MNNEPSTTPDIENIISSKLISIFNVPIKGRFYSKDPKLLDLTTTIISGSYSFSIKYILLEEIDNKSESGEYLSYVKICECYIHNGKESLKMGTAYKINNGKTSFSQTLSLADIAIESQVSTKRVYRTIITHMPKYNLFNFKNTSQ